MEQEVNKQHVQVPNNMGESKLDPRDQLIYAIIKSHDGKNGCFPSLMTISKESGASIPTVRESISRLVEKDYIKTARKGRKIFYTFNEYKKFEPFSPEFLKKTDISFTTKAYIVASQQYMYKDVENYGKMTLSNVQLSKEINMPESTIRKCNNELVSKEYLTIIKDNVTEWQAGKCDLKIFNLTSLGQAIIWAIYDHEERINQNTEDINNLMKRCSELENAHKEDMKTMESYKQLIDKLVEQINVLSEKINHTDFKI